VQAPLKLPGFMLTEAALAGRPMASRATLPLAMSAKRNTAARNYSDWLGKVSALTMIMALLLAAVFSHQKLFDTPFSGSIFVFGEMLALGTGIATWPNIWAKVGTLCSGLLLTFLTTAFLWVTFSKTV
jgi:hypothetical protein